MSRLYPTGVLDRPAARRLSAWRHLLPGPDFGVVTARVLLADACTASEIDQAITELTASGEVEPCTPAVAAITDAPPGVVNRYRFTTPESDRHVLPDDPDEQDAVHRVLRHLLSTCTAVAARLTDDHRFADVGSLPQFDSDAQAAGWFAAEWRCVMAAQRLAYALRNLPETWQIAESAYEGLRQAGRVEEQLTVQYLGADAAEQLGHPAAAGMRARVSEALSALGRYPEAVLAGRKALQWAELHDHDWSRSIAHQAIGRAHRGLDQIEPALAAFHTACDIERRRSVIGPDGHSTVPDTTSLGLLAAEVAQTHLRAGHPATAVEAAREAVSLLSGAPRRRRRDLVHATRVLAHALTDAGRVGETIGAIGFHELAEHHEPPRRPSRP